MECGPNDWTVALLYHDNIGPHVYVGMDTEPANAPLLPMPTAVRSPPLGSCERRHCRIHAAEGIHEHRISGSGQHAATPPAGALERFALQPPAKVAPEVGLADVLILGDHVYCAQLGDTTVVDYHLGVVRAVEPKVPLPLSRSNRHEGLLRDSVEGAHSAGLPAVGYAVAHAGRVVWAVALPCSVVALLTPFPVVPWGDMVSLKEASLGSVCTWHTHLAGMDPHRWQDCAVVTYLS